MYKIAHYRRDVDWAHGLARRDKRKHDDRTLARIVDMFMVFATLAGIGLVGGVQASAMCSQYFQGTVAALKAR